MDEYNLRIPKAIVTINDSADRLDEFSSKSGILSATAKVAFWPLSRKKTISTIVNEIWKQQEIKAVKYVVRPLLSVTTCLHGFLSSYIKKLKTVSKYLAKEEGKEMARDAYDIDKKKLKRKELLHGTRTRWEALSSHLQGMSNRRNK